MKKTKLLSVASVLLLASAGLIGCKPETPVEPIEADPLVENVLADFTQGKAKTVFASDGYSNGDVFNVKWSKNQVKYEDGTMKLGIVPNQEGKEATNDQYLGGEARTHQHFGYGDYSVKMKPAKKSGTASTFFTCTGPYEVVDGVENPHDEIDIEFLGKDTTGVQFNFFKNGVGGHEYWYKLGFDASEEFHEYGYRWEENAITWFVDNVPVYQVTGDATTLPSTPGRILMNHWCGTTRASGWMGRYNYTEGYSADYQKVSTTATPIGELPYSIDIPTGDPVALEFPGNDKYSVTQPEDKKSATISYTDLPGESYANVNANASVGVGKTVFAAKVKNNGANDATIRFNLQGEKQVGNTKCINKAAATSNDIDTVTDLDWGGTTLTLAPNQETTVAIEYSSNTPRGKLEVIELMIDSSIGGDAGHTHTGSIDISNFVFGGEEEVEDLPVVNPPVGESLDIQALWTSDPAYTITPMNADTKSLTVSYTEIAPWTCFGTTAPTGADSKDTISFDVKNEKETDLRVRVDLKNSSEAAIATEVSAANGSAAFVYEGAATVTVAAGVTETVTVKYDGALSSMTWFVDSSYDETPSPLPSGTCTISNFALSGGSVTVDPNALDIQALWTSDPAYVITPMNADTKSLTVTYTEMPAWACFGMSVPAGSDANNTVKVTIQNTGSATIRVRVDMKVGEAAIATAVTAENGSNAWVNNGELTVEIPAGTVENLSISYTGIIEQIVWFVDSSYDVAPSPLPSGSCVITNFYYENNN